MALVQERKFPEIAALFRSEVDNDDARLAQATELRDCIEVVYSSEYANFLQILLPVFIEVLQNEPPEIENPNPKKQKLRTTFLEILHRLPSNDQLRDYVPRILALATRLLEKENEENAVICLRIIVDLHKAYRPYEESQVKGFLAIVRSMYSALPKTVEDTFNRLRAAAQEEKANQPLVRSVNSFKVLTECPLIVVILLQLYKGTVQEQIPQFVPLIIQALALSAPQDILQMAAAAPAQEDPNHIKQGYTDFVACQVKTLSFLAYILSRLPDYLQAYKEHIPVFVIQLMHACPTESAAIRKELLVATRHILATDFRTSFISQIETLLDEQVLIGTGRTSYESLRPLAYSTLADLVHHVRNELPMRQLSRTIHVYSLNIHDPTLPLTIQTMSCKLLLNLIESIVKKNDSENTGRALLIRILVTFANKFAVLRRTIPLILKHSRQRPAGAQGDIPSEDNAMGDESMNVDNSDMDRQRQDSFSENGPPQGSDSDWTYAQPIQTPSASVGSQLDNIKDCRVFVKTLVLGLKTIVWGIASCNTAQAQFMQQQLTPQRRTIQPEEVQIFIRLLKDSLSCFDIYSTQPVASPEQSIGGNGGMLTFSKEEKEMLDHFAGVFTMLESAAFQEIFQSVFPHVFERILCNQALITIPQHFLANPSVSKDFAWILLKFLVERTEDLGSEDAVLSGVMLRLFKLVFGSVSLFNDQNERVLQPHLSSIILNSMRMATTVRNPINYFLLLRALFRSIGGGKFDSLYTEFLPLLPVLLANLNKLQSGSHPRQMRDLFVELCLTVPVRLSALLPYLHYLMRPLVLALSAGQSDLISQGLRTLELCVDNLTPEYLDPIVAPMRRDLLEALWAHLNGSPQSNNHWIAAMRILGKLGGRNRRVIKEPPTLTPKQRMEPGLQIKVYLGGPPDVQGQSSIGQGGALSEERVEEAVSQSNGCVTLPLDEAVSLAYDVLAFGPDSVTNSALSTHHIKPQRAWGMDGSSITSYQQRQAWRLARAAVAATIRLDPKGGEVADLAAYLDTSASSDRRLSRGQNDTLMDLDCEGVVFGGASLAAQRGVLVKALSAMLLGATVQGLGEEAQGSIKHTVRHFVLLMAVAHRHNTLAPTPPGTQRDQEDERIDWTVLVDAVVNLATQSDSSDWHNAAQSLLQQMVSDCRILAQSDSALAQLPLFASLADAFATACYAQEWYRKRGGIIGIRTLVEHLPGPFVWGQQLVFVRALMLVLKDMTDEVALGVMAEAQDMLMKVLQACNDPDKSSSQPADEQSAAFTTLAQFLITQLPSTSSVVREQAQAAFAELATLRKTTVAELLSSKELHDAVVKALVPKTVRSLVAETQIGILHALTWALKNKVLSFEPEKLPVMEVVQQCESEEAQKKAAQQAGQQQQDKDKDSTQTIQLRVQRLEFLAAVVEDAGFETCQALGQPMDVRNKFTRIFFAAFSDNPEEVVTVARKGLELLISQHKMPKDVLQNSLRPVLLSLADFRKLTVGSLGGLSRLLALLTNCFNDTLGEKLLEHLGKWADPQQMAAAGKVWSEGEMKICAAVIDIFHLLPRTALQFMEKLVKTVIELERQCQREVYSPFREPLIRFLSCFVEQSVQLFLTHLHDPAYAAQFHAILKFPGTSAEPLRGYLADNPKLLITHTFDAQPQGTASAEDLQLQGLVLVRLLCKHYRHYLFYQHDIRARLRAMWLSPQRLQRLQQEEHQPVFRLKESKLLVKCFLSCIRHQLAESPDEHTDIIVDLLFIMLSIFTAKTTIDFSFLTHFYQVEAPKAYSIVVKQKLLDEFLSVYPTATLSSNHKAMALQKLIIPMLASAFQNGETDELLTAPRISRVIETLINAEPTLKDDNLCIELLQLACLLVMQAHQTLQDHRKELIKFAWHHLKNEDTTVKHAGYVLISHFIKSYRTPEKIILQVYVQQLRAFQPEARTLVRQALDALVPALPERLQDDPTWIKLTRKVIMEEGHSLPQLTHVWSVVVRHADLFYASRAQLVPQMSNSLPRIGLPASAPIDNRRLGVDLAELVIRWELRRVEGGPPVAKKEDTANGDVPSGGLKREAPDEAGPPAKRVKEENLGMVPSAPGSPQVTSPAVDVSMVDAGGEDGPKDDDYRVNAVAMEMVVNFLIRVACTTSEQVSGSMGLPERCISLLRLTMQPAMWLGATIKYSYFDKVMDQAADRDTTKESHCSMASTALQILIILLENREPHQVVAHLSELQKALVLFVKFDDKTVLAHFQTLLQKILSVYPLGRHKRAPHLPPVPQPLAQSLSIERMQEAVTIKIREQLTQALADPNRGPESLGPAISLLHDVATQYPTYADEFLPLLLKALDRLVKCHKASLAPPAPRPAQQQQMSPAPQPEVSVLVQVLHLLQLRVEILYLHGGPAGIGTNGGLPGHDFVAQLLSLLDFSRSVPLLTTILDMTRTWVLSSQYHYPSMSEKSQLLLKMATLGERLERLGPNTGYQSLHTSFLELIREIYTADTLRSTDLVRNLEPAFMLGLRHESGPLQQQLFHIYCAPIGPTPFHRLMHCVSGQDWSAVGSYFWLTHWIDMVLSISVSGVPISSFPASDHALLPSLRGVTYRGPSVVPPSTNPTRDTPIHTLLSEHVAWLDGAFRSLTIAEVTAPLLSLCQLSSHLAADVWVHLMPRVWSLLSSPEQSKASNDLVTFVARRYHTDHRLVRPNPIATLLTAMHECSPPVFIPTPLYRVLSKTYGCWYLAIDSLRGSLAAAESSRTKIVVGQTTPLPFEPSMNTLNGADVPGVKGDNPSLDMEMETEAELMGALGELYRSLGETDLYFGLWYRRASSETTRFGMSLQQMGQWARALHAYVIAMGQSRAVVFNRGEFRVWQDGFIECCRNLDRYADLLQLAQTEKHNSLLLDCAWKLGDWTTESETLKQVEAAVPETAKIRLYKLYTAISTTQPQDLSVEDITKQVEKGMQLALEEWRVLPPIVTSSHYPCLELFQQFVEVQESATIMQHLRNPRAPTCPTELKMILNTWRDRLPNHWDEISVWNELLTWRHNIFTTINNAFAPYLPQGQNQAATHPMSPYLGYHEIAWSINRFAHVARKHGLMDVCLNALNRIYTLPNIEIHDAFLKLFEQAKCYYQLTADFRQGLDIINSTNLSYFKKEQKAEFFALKGCFLQRMGVPDEANQAFSTALHIFDGLSRGWVVWGRYCDQVFMENKNPLWGVNAINCHLNAARTAPTLLKSKNPLARAIWLLSFDQAGSLALAQGFEKYCEGVPANYWIPWIPQLLFTMYRPEAPHMMKALSILAKAHPQAVYYATRTFFLETRVQCYQQPGAAAKPAAAPATPAQPPGTPANPAQPGTAPTPTAPTPATPAAPGAPTPAATPAAARPAQRTMAAVTFEHFKKLMDFIRQTHPMLATSIEHMIEDLNGKFRPSTLEDLLRTMQVLLTECMQRSFANALDPKSPGVAEKRAPQTVEGHLKRVLQQGVIFSEKNPPMMRLKTQFEADFGTPPPGGFRLNYIIEKLREWQQRLTTELSAEPRVQRLEKVSRYLSEYSGTDIDLPGGHLTPQAAAGFVPKIARFESMVQHVHKHSAAYRRVFVRCHDGRVYPLLVQPLPQRHHKAEERVLQLFRLVNDMLDKHKETRKRQLQFYTPALVAISHSVRLLHDDPSMVTLEDVFAAHCSKIRKTVDYPVMLCYERLCAQEKVEPADKTLREFNAEMFKHITENVVPKDLLTKYVYASYDSAAEVWLFRRQFTLQLACVAFINYTMHMANRLPHTVSFSHQNACIMPTDLYPMLNAEGKMEAPSTVPFRLTPTLQHFITDEGIHGTFAASFLAIAQCLVNQGRLEDYLNVIFRDEIINWHSQSLLTTPAGATPRGPLDNDTLVDRTGLNVKPLLARIGDVVIPAGPNEPAKGEDGRSLPLHQKVQDLITIATSSDKLAQIDPTWHPWL